MRYRSKEKPLIILLKITNQTGQLLLKKVLTVPSQIYNFFELSAAFDLKPEQAIKHFQQKGLKASFSWMDMIGEEHDAAFTVAKMIDNDLLSYVDKQVDKMLDTGQTLADFKKELIPALQQAGIRRGCIRQLTLI